MRERSKLKIFAENLSSAIEKWRREAMFHKEQNRGEVAKRKFPEK